MADCSDNQFGEDTPASAMNEISELSRCRRIQTPLGVATLLLFAGCSTMERGVIALLYRKTSWPEAQIKRNVSYIREVESGTKHCLDLFLPNGTNWPVLVFVPGGGWTTGDKGLRVGGADVYGNIGRFFAVHGIGVAVVNYRLQPVVDWRGQVEDVARATSWVAAHVGEYGVNPDRIFLAGHSAGAQLICDLALNPSYLAQSGLPSNSIAGVVAVSGAGLDLSDQKTYSLGASFSYYEERFNRSASNPNWQHEASPIHYVQADAPPFLILYGGREKPALKRQSHLLHEALSSHGVPNQIIEVPRQSHGMMVLTLSRDDKKSGPAILSFIEKTSDRRK
jgi:acetyl esterase/lipase